MCDGGEGEGGRCVYVTVEKEEGGVTVGKEKGGGVYT